LWPWWGKAANKPFRSLITIDEKGIAHVVCRGLNIDPKRWDLFKVVVREEIRLQRTNCNTALRREYLGEFIHCERENGTIA
jgi:hypothetical protein